MSRFISIIIGIIITLSSSLSFCATAYAAIGLDNNGHLSACPSSPNCVVSQDGDEKHIIEPIAYQGDRHQAKETLLKVLSVVPRTKIIEDTGNYIHAESTSRIFKFVDDAEFYFPEDQNVIQVRSASRVGESDLGVNRRRIEQIRLAMEDLGA
ncbi:hypothetical protein C7B62_10285 [Pleurocapsa sp. CCALA 161]|uniref:DUF1499 domain-containing protein n=1 Tax=Pleurocapsa sp. CCALA 161 TaxID=2107688 RepID=UPI000D080ADA|nr:DUF1499 domain-containing protein [Pleurocapsa sp. CCALA 161]PSB10203.1 hypothetical protein C7B62_10285 [Pleurocapsa sp. CCALA 161]